MTKRPICLWIALLFLLPSLCFAENTSLLPVNQSFCEVIGMDNIEDVKGGIIVSEDGKCADVDIKDLTEWLKIYWNFTPYDRVISPYDNKGYDGTYVKFWTENKEKTFVVYSNGGVIAGTYGYPYESHGEIKKNYVWYLPYIGNGRNALYIADTKLRNKYIHENSDEFIGVLRDVTFEDTEVLTETNLLNINGASSWAETEILNAAACNLLPYELIDKYDQNITRKEFCYLIYRLIATEFSPNSDSRMGEWSVIDNIINERELVQKYKSVSFSDCEDEKIKQLAATDIVYGVGDRTFSPDLSITREEAATILLRTAEFLGNKTTIKSNNENIYDDEDLISEWAKESVKSMKAMNIMIGVSGNKFEPKDKFTVEQAILTALRLYECY